MNEYKSQAVTNKQQPKEGGSFFFLTVELNLLSNKLSHSGLVPLRQHLVRHGLAIDERQASAAGVRTGAGGGRRRRLGTAASTTAASAAAAATDLSNRPAAR